MTRLVVLMLVLASCRLDSEPPSKLSQIDQEVNRICELLPRQMGYCAFPSDNGFGCHCDRQECLRVMNECGITDPTWWQHCFQACPYEAVEVPPFDPASDCEELLDSHSLPHWHICHFPRCWDLDEGETCIVPMGGGGGFES